MSPTFNFWKNMFRLGKISAKSLKKKVPTYITEEEYEQIVRGD